MKQLFSLAFLILVLNFNAQIKHEFGSENIPAKDLRYNEILGGDASSFYIHKTSTKGKGVTHFIQKIDRKGMTFYEPKELKIEDGGDEIKVNRIIVSDDELMVFITKNKQKSKIVNFLVINLDLNSLTKIKETELTSLEMDWQFIPRVNVKLSSSGKKAALKVCAATTNPKGITTLFAVYDLAKATKLWDQKVNEDFKENAPMMRQGGDLSNGVVNDVNDFEIDDIGNIHYSYLALNKNSTKKNAEYDLHYNVISSESLLKDIVLPADVKCDAWDLKLTVLQNSKVSVSGVYTETEADKKYEDRNSGIFNFIIDYTKPQILSKKFTLAKVFNPNGETDYNPKGIKKHYNIDKTLPFGNSSILLGHKSANIGVVHNSGSALDYTSMQYYDLFVARVNQNGEIEFFKNLPFSSRISTNSYIEMMYLKQIVKQYFEVINGDNLYVFHNENPAATKTIESGDKSLQLNSVMGSAKHFVCNKISLKDGVNTRAIVELPLENGFNPILEVNFNMVRPLESDVFNNYKNEVYVPVNWREKMERFLKITLD